MKKIILFIILSAVCQYAMAATQTTDTNNVIMTSKPVAVTHTDQGWQEVLPKGLTQTAGYVGYMCMYSKSPIDSATLVVLRIIVKITNISTMRAYLQSKSLDPGTNTTTAYVLQ